MALNMIWRLSLAVTALLVVAGQSIPKVGEECDQKKYAANPDDCTSFWGCEEQSDGRFRWAQSKCINGLAFNQQRNVCEPPETPCQGLEEAKDIPNQRAIIPGCESVFVCPVDLVLFIYPNWNNCNQFYQCTRGVITLGSCSSALFPFFNPSTFACDNTARVSNPCTNRLL